MDRKYDIAVSYASEQREYVEKFVNFMEKKKLYVFYDRNEQARLVGKLLHEELSNIYKQETMIRVIFLSNEYINKPYTKLEAEIILAENVYEKNKMFIFKFDEVSYPGLNRNILYSCIEDYPDANDYANLIYAAIRKSKYKLQKDSFKELNNLVYRKLKNLEKSALEIKVIREIQKLTYIYRVYKRGNILSFLQICKDADNETLYIWLYKNEPMEKNGAYNALIYIENNNYVLNNRGILNSLDVIINYSSLEELSSIIFDGVRVYFGY